jgi:uncharacterized protein
MNYLFELTHPKHYYQFKVVIKALQNNSANSLLVIARNKDVLLKVLEEDDIPFVIYGKHGKSMISKLFVLPNLLYTYLKIIRNNNIDVVISKASPYAALLSKLLKIKTIITPDSEVVNITKKLVAPVASLVITPENYALNYEGKHKRIIGFFEDCYLAPSVFTPDKSLVKQLGFSLDNPYFILRFISWNANHDINNFGFSQDEKIHIVNILKACGDVYISSEGLLPKEIEKYRIVIPPSKIHHVLHYATMYIGDSQTMATESALLGTPSIRFNSFVGENDMTNFKLLEEKFKLLKNFNNFSDVLFCINEFINNPENKDNWLKKRANYYTERGDVNNEIFSFIADVK